MYSIEGVTLHDDVYVMAIVDKSKEVVHILTGRDMLYIRNQGYSAFKGTVPEETIKEVLISNNVELWKQ